MKNQLKEELIGLYNRENESAVSDLSDQLYQAGYDEGQEEAEADAEDEIEELEGRISELEDEAVSDPQLIEFAVEKFKEMNIRGISPEQMLAELESELCRHMPVTGPTLFSKKP